MTGRRRVAVVTGGGGGIGAAIAESIGRTGIHVVTLDPLVSVDGAEQLPQPEETTAGRIVAAGGSASASSASVADADAVATLFSELADEFGGLDAVVNVAGISRPTGFGRGSESDWRSVLSVHLDGYLNVLSAALPLMAAAGRGHIVGVTSGSGWRAADAGAYGCAKRAVAALTWQLGRNAPEGVVVNAVSPIAATRMVAAALGRTETKSGTATGGLSLGAMPAPEDLGPLGAHLIDPAFEACHGRVIFAGGSEIAVIDEPRLIEVVRLDDSPSATGVLEAATTIALAPAEARQVSGGGSNARFGQVFETREAPSSSESACAVYADDPATAKSLCAALRARGVTAHLVDSPEALRGLADLDGVIVAAADHTATTAESAPWQRALATYDGIVDRILDDARWTRAVADYAATRERQVRLVQITAATSEGGRSRAQAAAQLARAGRKATADRVFPFTVSVESDDVPADLAAHLVCSPDVVELAGAELVSGAGWFGLRSHPRPIGSISFGGPAVPPWFDDALREVVR